MDTNTVRAAVAEAFTNTGKTTPPWPDPHARTRGSLEPAMPREEEYSRCTDPGKYRIVGARADAWVQALTGLGLATVEDVTGDAADYETGPRFPPDRAVRLRPVHAGAVPLLLGYRALQDAPEAIVDISAGEPAVPVETLPDCGCDACDSGSEGLLIELDRPLMAVVAGDFVHVTTPRGVVTATRSGWSASGRFRRREVERTLADARAGRSGHPVVRGEPWW
jgi:hypothetical protein